MPEVHLDVRRLDVLALERHPFAVVLNSKNDRYRAPPVARNPPSGSALTYTSPLNPNRIWRTAGFAAAAADLTTSA